MKIIHNHQLEITTLITFAHFTSMQLNKFTYGSPMPCAVFQNLDQVPPYVLTQHLTDQKSLPMSSLLHFNSTMQANVLPDGCRAPRVSEMCFLNHEFIEFYCSAWHQRTFPLRPLPTPSNAFGRHDLSFKILFKDGFGHSLRILLQATKSIGWKVHAMWHLVAIWDSIRSFCRW